MAFQANYFGPISFLFLAISTGLFLSHSAGEINPICKPTHYIRLCQSIINGARNANDATINAIHAAISNSQDIQKLLPLIAKAAENLPPKAREALVKSCTVNFQDSVSELSTSIIFIGRGDMHAVNSFLYGALSATNDCRDAVNKEVGALSALNKSVDHFNQVMDVTLSLAHQIRS